MPEEPDGGLADLEDEDGADDAEPGESCAPRRRRGRRTLPEALPRVEIEVLPPEVIQEGQERFERLGQEVSEVVERGLIQVHAEASCPTGMDFGEPRRL